MSIREFVQMCCWFFVGQHFFVWRMRRAMRTGKFLDFIRQDKRNTVDVVMAGCCDNATAEAILKGEPTCLHYSKMSRVYGMSQETTDSDMEDDPIAEVKEPTHLHYSKMSRVYNASKGAT